MRSISENIRRTIRFHITNGRTPDREHLIEVLRCHLAENRNKDVVDIILNEDLIDIMWEDFIPAGTIELDDIQLVYGNLYTYVLVQGYYVPYYDWCKYDDNGYWTNGTFVCRYSKEKNGYETISYDEWKMEDPKEILKTVAKTAAELMREKITAKWKASGLLKGLTYKFKADTWT